MVFGGDILSRLAKASPTDIPKIVKDIEAFGDSIPEPVKECLDGNAELEALGKKYGITPDSNSTEIVEKVLKYVSLHFLEVHGMLGKLNTEWQNGKYYDVGKDGGAYGHKILGSSRPTVAGDPQAIMEKVIAYLTSHYIEVDNWLQSLNKQWNSLRTE